MAIPRILLLMLLLLPVAIPSFFAHGSRLSAEERRLLRTAEENVNPTAPDSKFKTNDTTVWIDGNVASSPSSSGFDDSDRLVPTGPNPLHHRH